MTAFPEHVQPGGDSATSLSAFGERQSKIQEVVAVVCWAELHGIPVACDNSCSIEPA